MELTEDIRAISPIKTKLKGLRSQRVRVQECYSKPVSLETMSPLLLTPTD